MLYGYVIFVVVSQVAYGGGTGVGISTNSFEGRFKSLEDCTSYAQTLAKKISTDTGVKVSVSCAYTGG